MTYINKAVEKKCFWSPGFVSRTWHRPRWKHQIL